WVKKICGVTLYTQCNHFHISLSIFFIEKFWSSALVITMATKATERYRCNYKLFHSIFLHPLMVSNCLKDLSPLFFVYFQSFYTVEMFNVSFFLFFRSLFDFVSV